MSHRDENRNCQHVHMRLIRFIPLACYCCFLQGFVEHALFRSRERKRICVHIHPALDSPQSENSKLGPAGGMISDRSEHFPSQSHVNTY
jgi:hypothetical protein